MPVPMRKGIATIALLLVAVPQISAQEAEIPDAIGGVIRYVELKPTFIANYGISDIGALKYVRADVTVRVSNKDAEYAARYHLAALRNRIVLLLSRQDESTVASAAGRETLKAEALAELREVLETEEGEPHIDDVMFTNFVVQR
ncbi:MAG: flagellar basal body-associated FliL family protein [Pseudomonadota bacterium]